MTIARDIVLQPEISIDVEPGAVTLYDLSRYKNNGTFVNAPTWVQLPFGLWVVDFVAASAQYINIPDAPSLDLIDNMTMECWYNCDILPSVVGVHAYLMVKFGTYGIFISLVDNKIYWGETIQAVSTTATDIGVWHYLAGTYDSNLGTQNIKLYIDGVLDATANDNTGWAVNANPITIGDRVAGGRTYDGKFSPLRICNYTLTAGQVLNRFENQKHWFGVHD